MDTVDHSVTFIIKSKHALGKHIPCGSLNARLKDAGADELIVPPLASKRILTPNKNAVLKLSPWRQLLLDLGTLPTDKTSGR